MQHAGLLDQPAPIPRTGDMWQQVIDRWSAKSFVSKELVELMRERREFGISKYGVPVQAQNGRSSRIDFVAELLDAIVYNEQIATEEPEIAPFCYAVQRDLMRTIEQFLPDNALATLREKFVKVRAVTPASAVDLDNVVEPSVGDYVQHDARAVDLTKALDSNLDYSALPEVFVHDQYAKFDPAPVFERDLDIPNGEAYVQTPTY